MWRGSRSLAQGRHYRETTALTPKQQRSSGRALEPRHSRRLAGLYLARSLEREYHTLEAQHATLESPVRLDMQARQFGMMFPGECQHFVRGLPNS